MRNQLVILYVLVFVLSACTSYHEPDLMARRAASIYPDYTQVELPANIAPTNFRIEEIGDEYQVEIGIEGNDPAIILSDRSPVMEIPEADWHDLLLQAAGQRIYFRISVKNQGLWTCYKDILNTISTDTIDNFLVYRLLYPGYELWNEMGIYQRDLRNFDETTLVSNKNISHQCVNCHAFTHNQPDNMMLHVRGKQGGTLIYHNGQIEKVSPKPVDSKFGATYPSWHPRGKFIAFSANEIQQYFHISGTKPIEVADLSADLFLYDVEHHEVITVPILSQPDYLETFPTWSPNGQTLYFCRAHANPQKVPLDSIRYDLCSITFSNGNLHQPSANVKVLFPASAKGKSVSFPVASPDGKYLMFTLFDYGNFSIWHPESDLWLLDLKTGKSRSLKEVNSRDVESWHGWSSNGRWFTFSSKRIDGGWARPYFAHFDPNTGQASKPFLLPQRSPDFYSTFLQTYNRPELISKPVTYGKQLEQKVASEVIRTR